jgi:hypothetical protein
VVAPSRREGARFAQGGERVQGEGEGTAVTFGVCLSPHAEIAQANARISDPERPEWTPGDHGTWTQAGRAREEGRATFRRLLYVYVDAASQGGRRCFGLVPLRPASDGDASGACRSSSPRH